MEIFGLERSVTMRYLSPGGSATVSVTLRHSVAERRTGECSMPWELGMGSSEDRAVNSPAGVAGAATGL